MPLSRLHCQVGNTLELAPSACRYRTRSHVVTVAGREDGGHEMLGSHELSEVEVYGGGED